MQLLLSKIPRSRKIFCSIQKPCNQKKIIINPLIKGNMFREWVWNDKMVREVTPRYKDWDGVPRMH